MELQEWLAAVAAELGVADAALDEAGVATLLDLTRDAAHEVERVAAPLTAYLAGVAVGRGAGLAATAQTVTDLLAAPSPDPAG